jgi:hypothetical protein
MGEDGRRCKKSRTTDVVTNIPDCQNESAANTEGEREREREREQELIPNAVVLRKAFTGQTKKKNTQVGYGSF